MQTPGDLADHVTLHISRVQFTTTVLGRMSPDVLYILFVQERSHLHASGTGAGAGSHVPMSCLVTSVHILVRRSLAAVYVDVASCALTT